MNTTITRRCVECGHRFTREARSLTAPGAKYCSPACSLRAKDARRRQRSAPPRVPAGLPSARDNPFAPLLLNHHRART